MNVTYYHILDLDMVGKEEDYVPYLYKPEIGWVWMMVMSLWTELWDMM